MSGHRILYAVLNWGLGHASRSVPVVGALRSAGCEVVLAGDGLSLDLMSHAFPDAECVTLLSYNVQYPWKSPVLNGIWNARNILRAVSAERDKVRELLSQHRFDAIISDNRYGCYSPGVPSIILSHQLCLPHRNPVIRWAGTRRLRKWLKPFDEIWVPDDPKRTLSGALSDIQDERIRFTGWLSSLIKQSVQEEYVVAAILSGPEPARSRLERETAVQLIVKISGKCALVRGCETPHNAYYSGNVEVSDTLTRKEINTLTNVAEIVLCRSGYSSLMDLLTLGKKAILVPTPGQPEQQFLARRVQSLPQFVVQRQKHLDLKAGIEALRAVPEVQPWKTDDLLITRIRDFLSRL